MATKNVNVKKGNSTSVEMTNEQIREFARCAKDPIHFIQNYVYVRHPVKGRTLFNLYDYQVELINAYHDNKDVITLFPRQSGKCCEASTQLTTLQTKHTSTFRKFILKLFFKQVYNQLWPTTPKIQKSYNRTSNLFNKLSATLLNWCLSPTQQSIGELWSNQSQYPVDIIDSTTGELKFTEQSAPTDLFVLAPTGFQPVKHIHKTVPYDVWELRVQECEPLLCADTHIVLNADGIERYVKDLQVGELINTQFGPKPVISCGLSTLPSSTMFDLELADANHVYYTNNILSHNSETSCAYLFWFSIFNKDKTVLITSNKHKNSSEMISRIKYMYESLPDFLKPGVTDDGWNKLSLKFETGSRIISDATSETTGRGGSFSILYCLGGETTVTVRNKKTGEISVVSLQDLHQKMSTKPPSLA